MSQSPARVTAVCSDSSAVAAEVWVESTAVSSAKRLHFVCGTVHAMGRSIVYVRKSRGPRTEPWGTPAGMVSHGEVTFAMRTL